MDRPQQNSGLAQAFGGDPTHRQLRVKGVQALGGLPERGSIVVVEAAARVSALNPVVRETERAAQAKERDEKCATYKARLQKFLTSRRLYREDEYGERVYLDEAEMLAARERVQGQVEEYCGS